MSLTFTCPQCSRKLAATDAQQGKRVRCPKCKAAVAIPAVGITAAVPPAPPPVLGPAVTVPPAHSPPVRVPRWYTTGVGLGAIFVVVALLAVAAVPVALWRNREAWLAQQEQQRAETAALAAEEARIAKQRADDETRRIEAAERQRQADRLAKEEADRIERGAVPVTASVLFRDFRDHPEWARQQYVGKLLKVQGEGSTCEGGTELSGGVRCEMVRRYRPEELSGDSVFVIGTCREFTKAGFFSRDHDHVTLAGCVLGTRPFVEEQLAEMGRFDAARQKRDQEREKTVAARRAKEEEERRKRAEQDEKFGSSASATQFAEEFVKRLLRYPDKANFSWLFHDAVRESDNSWTVSGKFEAVNVFGVSENMRYVVGLRYDHRTRTWHEMSVVVLNEAGRIVAQRGEP